MNLFPFGRNSTSSKDLIYCEFCTDLEIGDNEGLGRAGMKPREGIEEEGGGGS